MTKISKRLLLVSGFNLPSKAPMEPKAKKARLALAMFSWTDFEGLRSSLSQTPTLGAHVQRGLRDVTFLT